MRFGIATETGMKNSRPILEEIMDALELLKQNHEDVKELFQQAEGARTRAHEIHAPHL
jgi:uncharacterized coiled-coil DUF342 family protein